MNICTLVDVQRLQAQGDAQGVKYIKFADLVEFFGSLKNTAERVSLPPGTPWFVIRPGNPALLVWNMFLQLISLYFFIEVPFNIAFRATVRLKTPYKVLNTVLEILLIIDLFFHANTAFVSAHGMLVCIPKAIRQAYVEDVFFLDLLAATPFDLLVQANGHVNQLYVSWLRLPRMLRIYRVYRMFKANPKTAKRPTVANGVMQLFPFVLAMNHLAACLWWYIGTFKIKDYTDPNPGEAVEINYELQESAWVNFYLGAVSPLLHAYSPGSRARMLVPLREPCLDVAWLSIQCV